ncbi:MAG: hypothetical protein MJ185_07530 [Treponema sp.]|nr:hypothetical protein [Treponema sp.]
MIGEKESDYWKQKINEFQHKNMTRPGAERLSFSDVKCEIESFEKNHPELTAKTSDNGSYITWEILVTSSVKFRVFFQSQIKASLMDVTAGEAVKICDVKCFYNPFPEIEEFVNKIPEYKKELEELLKSDMQLSKKQKVAGEFIKAYIQAKISADKYLWQLVPENQLFNLILRDTKTAEEKIITLSSENFLTELNNLPK